MLSLGSDRYPVLRSGYRVAIESEKRSYPKLVWQEIDVWSGPAWWGRQRFASRVLVWWSSYRGAFRIGVSFAVWRENGQAGVEGGFARMRS